MLTTIKISNINHSSIHIPKKLNLDKSRKYLASDEAYYLFNYEVNNPSSLGKGVTMAANYAACEMELPAGENYAPNNYLSPITNENYTWHYNSNNVHFISRTNGDGICEIVYEGECLRLSADPKHQITQFRAILDVDYLCNKVPGGKLKRLVWVDGTDTPMGSLDVEASIATNFFTTPFFDICPDPCAYIQLCVPEIEGCIMGEWVPFTDSDKFITNRMVDRGFKFAIRHIYYDGRASLLSDWSTLYFQDARGCFDNSEGFPRCMKFRIPMGNPMVEKVEFYFSEDGGLTWFLADTIEKYKKYNSGQQYWYERGLSDAIVVNTDCTFDYIFCNDKQRIPIDPDLLVRVTNPIPREAQGLFRIKDSIAAYNYVGGTCPVDKNEIDKIQIGINCDDTISCNVEIAEVTVRAIIYNSSPPNTTARTAYIYRSGGAVGAIDDLEDKAHFGMGIKQYEQNFAGEVRNFMPYIDGTNYVGEMKQWKSSPGFAVGNRVEVGVLAGVLSQDEIDRVNEDIANGNFYYQEYKFKVKKGTKGFIRIASHSKENALGVNQNTSTQVLGILPVGSLFTHTGSTIVSGYDENVKEIYFDTCNGNVDNFDAFIIEDIIYQNTGSAYSGYVTDKNSQPVVGALMYANGVYVGTTDYNGFWYFAGTDTTRSMTVDVEQSCDTSFTMIETFGALSPQKNMAHVDKEIDSEFYKDNFLATVNVLVKDCDGVPVRGVRVVMSGAKYRVTDADGVARFKLRNYVGRDRSVVAVVMDRGNCFTIDCNGNCNPCMPSTSSFQLDPCFQTNPSYTLLPTTQLNTSNVGANKKLLKMGGTYDMGIVLEGDCGKISAVYNIAKFNIPRMQELGGFGVCQFSYDINNATFPAWAKRGKIVRSANLNPFTLQWVVDEIDRTIDGKIVLTIQSLNDYNTKYNFKTNTGYSYSQGDRVEFIVNGDGDIFDSAVHGVLNYQIISPFNNEVISGVTDDVDFFNQIQIVDDGKLDTLKKGAVIQINPTPISSQQVTYFEFCASFSITNGQADIQSGVFQTFDTYLVNRQIEGFPPMFFEHKSPSDFWGNTVAEASIFMSDIGKAHFVNPYENERRFPRNISVNIANQLNYFGSVVKTLDAESQGAIIAINVKDDFIGLAICENDNFIFQVSDDLLRVGSDGTIRASNTGAVISRPEPKIRGEYGCQYEDIGSILFGDGFAVYVDANNGALIIHNYQMAQKAGLSTNQQTGSVESSCNTFFERRVHEKAFHNKNSTNFLDYYRYSIGQNKNNGCIYLTLKSMRHSGVNNASGVYELPNDTIMYTPITDNFLGFAPFTPEGYSQLNLSDTNGCSFLSFVGSVPYIHPVIADKWSEFYGIPVDQFIGITLNKFDTKIKVPLAIEVQSEEMFYVKKVTTNQPNFISEIPAIRWKKSERKWNAAFLNNVNSIGGLYSGDRARDYEISVLFVKDNTNGYEYGSIDNNKRISYNEIDKIMFKFMLSESSGQTENL